MWLTKILFKNYGAIKDQRGLMHSMFYNCCLQQFSNSNMTYGGWKYFFYWDLTGVLICRINNCTFEGGDSEHKNIARIIEITSNQNWCILTIQNTYCISTNFDITPIHIYGAQNKFVLKLDADFNTMLLTNININADIDCSATVFYISDKGLDARGTRRRVGCFDPHTERGRAFHSTISIPVNKLVEYGFPQSFKDIFEADGITSGNIYASILSMTRGNLYIQLNYLDIGRTMWHITEKKQLYWDGWVWRDADGNQMSYNVQYHLTGCYLFTDKYVQPAIGEQKSLKIYADSGYSKPTSITITMGGTELVQGTDFTYDSSSGYTKILGTGGTGGVTGDIVLTAEAVKN